MLNAAANSSADYHFDRSSSRGQISEKMQEAALNAWMYNWGSTVTALQPEPHYDSHDLHVLKPDYVSHCL